VSLVRIGVNALYLIPGGVGGTEIYLRSLLTALAEIDSDNEYFIYVNRETRAAPLPAAPQFRVVQCNVGAGFRPFRIIYEQIVLPLLLRASRVDVLFNPGFTVPVLAPCPSVTVFHDLQHRRFPRFFRSRDLPFWSLLLWLAAERSSRLIAVSEATARDIRIYMPRHSGKTSVVHHGVDPEFFNIGERGNKRGPGGDSYVLAVSTLHPHKNLERLLDAFCVFLKSGYEGRLVIAGLKGLAARRLEERARDLLQPDRVCFTGWIPRGALYRLFEDASAFISPSLFEGFGLPVVEALAAGIPTACSAIPVYEEIAGRAVISFDPMSVSEIVRALKRITGDREFRAQAAIAGPARARMFDWNRSAALTLCEFRRAAGVSSGDSTENERNSRPIPPS